MILQDDGFGVAEGLRDVLPFGFLLESNSAEAPIDAVVFVEPGGRPLAMVVSNLYALEYIPASILINWLQFAPQRTERFARDTVAMHGSDNVWSGTVDGAMDHIAYQMVRIGHTLAE